MSKPPFDLLHVPCPRGDAVARYVEAAGSLQGRWEISFPWGTEAFRAARPGWGSLTDLYAHMRQRIAERDASHASEH